MKRAVVVHDRDLNHMPLFDDSLRAYQREAVLAIRQSYREGKKAVMLCLPTGTGKIAHSCACQRTDLVCLWWCRRST